jgi:hypothetical protein
LGNGLLLGLRRGICGGGDGEARRRRPLVILRRTPVRGGGGFGGGDDFLLHGLGGEESKGGRELLKCLRRGRWGEGAGWDGRIGGTRWGRVARLLCARDTQSTARTDSLCWRYGPSVRCGQKLLPFFQIPNLIFQASKNSTKICVDRRDHG